jgi:hypothetical protein
MNTGPSSIVGIISLESVVDDSSHESSIAIIAAPRDGPSHAGKEGHRDQGFGVGEER